MEYQLILNLASSSILLPSSTYFLHLPSISHFFPAPTTPPHHTSSSAFPYLSTYTISIGHVHI